MDAVAEYGKIIKSDKRYKEGEILGHFVPKDYPLKKNV